MQTAGSVRFGRAIPAMPPVTPSSLVSSRTHLLPYLDNREAPWSYRVEVRARLILDELECARRIWTNLSVKRNLRKSIRQQSHIQVSPAEYGGGRSPRT